MAQVEYQNPEAQNKVRFDWLLRTQKRSLIQL